MEFEDFPLLNMPNIMLTVLRTASAGPTTLDDCLAALGRTLTRAHEHPEVEPADILAHITKARDHLLAADFLRGLPPDRFAITERGRQMLAEHLTGIDDSILEQFAEFRAYLEATAKHRLGESEAEAEIAEAKEYDHGYMAFVEGKTQRDNPYDFDSAAHFVWDCGWFAALDEDIGERRANARTRLR